MLKLDFNPSAQHPSTVFSLDHDERNCVGTPIVRTYAAALWATGKTWCVFHDYCEAAGAVTTLQKMGKVLRETATMKVTGENPGHRKCEDQSNRWREGSEGLGVMNVVRIYTERGQYIAMISQVVLVTQCKPLKQTCRNPGDRTRR
ncbi:hypothetical protein C8R42DRAFT_641572 [Lentinula raphanica]|nr:hypothetical protein C8R42DRAFT_641572 [Lentinula raphanica]